MMIYNTVDDPIIVTLGDKSYRMERDSELEVKIPSGEYYFQIYKLDPRTDEPLRKFKTDVYPATHVDLHRGKWKRTAGMAVDEHCNSTVICYGVAALLRMRRDTKLYIREVYADRLLFKVSSERYFTQNFDLTVENGELTQRKDGCVDELTRQKLIRSVYWEIGFTFFCNLLCIAAIALLLYWLSSNGKFYITANIKAALGYIFLPIFFAICLIYDLCKLRKVKELKNLPLLPTKADYDYL